MTATTTELAMSETPDISVVIPLLNESESLPEFAAWIDRVMTANRFRYEAIFIDDGSRNVDTAQALGFAIYMPAPQEDFGHLLESVGRS